MPPALFVWRDFVAQYKQTILGPLWHLIQPLFTILLFKLIFGRVAKLLSALVETFRYAFLGASSFDPWQLAYSAALILVILFIGLVLFNHVERTFIDTV